MGRPKKPTALKILDGDKPSRIPADEPKSPPGLGSPPAWLGDLEREAWSTLSDRLDEMGVATRADSEMAMIYCQAYATWRDSLRVIAREGRTITTDTTTKLHPLFTAMHEAQRVMIRCLSSFGMTPSARASLSVPGRPENDEVLSFLAGG